MRPMNRKQFERAMRKAGFVATNQGKGSHAKRARGNDAFTVPHGKEVPHYCVKQAKAFGVRF